MVCLGFAPDTLLLFADSAPDSSLSFFLVILCRWSASRMPLSLHPNASAISDWYASGCSPTYAFSFSGSIFRKPRCSSFFPKSPVSFSCFSHSCIVDLDTLNVWWVSSSVCPACLYSIVRSRYFLNNSCLHFTTSFTCFQPWLLYHRLACRRIYR